ncbi:hypothetical protein EDD80_101306 [Anseongella ginsenosidimutans]|uniref:Uncharacterized protein n=1 Tax=Anseongella ginsenosidimutans TaxID=496056 RepID=A0A4R3KXD9_9SPHI|nr:hypothetical protein [Anseongella ginsenosidimutans]QEC51218.1 hypothetical protein FRZ59_01850 [Anseongella ginsenosidimutans]TCS90108.1 hypothetical protein EDD80_101306 [Anseongella ginsenosidimutans]
MNLSEKNGCSISERLEKSLKDFLEYHSPAFLGRNIRRMAFLYLRQSLREGFHDEMPDFLDQLDTLLDFLDIAEEETAAWRTGKA